MRNFQSMVGFGVLLVIGISFIPLGATAQKRPRQSRN